MFAFRSTMLARFVLFAIGLLGLAVYAPPSAALPLIIGDGWTAADTAGVTYGAVTGTGKEKDAFVFTLQLSSEVGVATTIRFTNDGTSATGEGFFNITLIGENTGPVPWTGLRIVIDDTTLDPVITPPPGAGHPERAHVHRSAWSEAASDHFKCVDDYCGGNGRYDMTLGLKDGANPIAQNEFTDGKILRLHDIDEAPAAGQQNNPMQFNLILTPVPEPGTLLLLGSGIVGLLGCRRKRK